MISMTMITPNVTVDRRLYERYRSMRRVLVMSSDGSQLSRVRRECLDLHFELFYSGKPVRSTVLQTVPHPLWGLFEGLHHDQ